MKNKILLVIFSWIFFVGCGPARKIVVVAPSGGLSVKAEIQKLNKVSYSQILEEVISSVPSGKKIGVVKNGMNDMYDDILYGVLKSNGLSAVKGSMEALQRSQVDYYLIGYVRARGTMGEGFPSKNTYTAMKYILTLIDAASMSVTWSKELVKQQVKEYDLDKVGGVFGL